MDPAVHAWHDFYVTAGAAAATLVGLLFVGLTIHIQVVVSHADVRSLARVTLMDFFVVLLVALVVLAPLANAQVTGGWLLGVAAISVVLSLRPALAGMRSRMTIGVLVFVARFGLSVAGYLGLGVAGVLLSRGSTDVALSLLMIFVVVLLMVAVRNTWDLLVVVADRPARA